MIKDNLITVPFDEFRESFPDLQDATDAQIKAASIGARAYITPRIGAISLDPILQELGVFLGTAHLVYLNLNQDAFRSIVSASQGSVSASFASAPASGTWEYFLSTTKYGLQLLSILKQIQPLIPGKKDIPGFYGNK